MSSEDTIAAHADMLTTVNMSTSASDDCISIEWWNETHSSNYSCFDMLSESSDQGLMSSSDAGLMSFSDPGLVSSSDLDNSLSSDIQSSCLVSLFPDGFFSETLDPSSLNIDPESATEFPFLPMVPMVPMVPMIPVTGPVDNTASEPLNEPLSCGSCPCDSGSDSDTFSQHSISVKPAKSKRKAKHEWTRPEDDKLIRIYKQVARERGDSSKRFKSWPIVARQLNRELNLKDADCLTAKQCREHYSRLCTTHKKHSWSDDENEILDQYLQGKISMEELYSKLNRTKKQIQERIKTVTKSSEPWTPVEDNTAMSLFNRCGDRWKNISDAMWEQGFRRDYQQVKSRVTALLKRFP